MQSSLSLTPLRNALKSLEDILAQPVNEYIRDGIIQRFEFTFELSWKTLKRIFKDAGREDILTGPKPVIREAGKMNLISDVEAWLNFLYARNTSAHVYNDSQAEEVYQSAKKFPQYVHELLKKLEKYESTSN